jgi:ATP-dependent protease ClpP protease subunit
LLGTIRPSTLDYFLSAEDARTFGIIDEVITKRHPLDETIQKLMPVS